MDGWIKLYRKLMKKGYYTDSHYVHLWVHLLMKANHQDTEFLFNNAITLVKRGQFITGREELSRETGINTSKVERVLKVFKSEHQIEQQTFNKFRIITICNYDQFQPSEQQSEQPVNNKRTASEQPVNTNKNDKNERNNLSKDKLVKTSYGNEEVELVLNLYQKHTGNLPTDKRPRHTAQNIVQITKTLIKDIRPHYDSVRIGELTPEFILNKAFEWYFGQLKDDVEVTKLDTVKQNIRARFYEATRRKYVPDYKLKTLS